MEINTYQITEDQEVLVYKETYDKNKNLIHYIDYYTKPNTEKKYEYNSEGLMTRESELNNGQELNVIDFRYNEEGKLIEQNLSFSEILYEKIAIEINDSGFIKTIYQDGIEVEKIEKIVDGKNFINKFYDNQKLIGLQTYTFDSKSLTSTTEIFDDKNDLIGIRRNQYNNSEEIIKFEEFNDKEQLLLESNYELKSGLLIKELYRDFRGQGGEYIIENKFDDNKNLVSTETRTLNNDLLDFHIKKYDLNNQLIEENGFSRGNFNAIYGTHLNSELFHFVHKYIKE